MNTINPTSTHPHEDFFPSHYLGMPVKKGFEGYWDPPFSDMVTIITHIKKRFPNDDSQPDDNQCIKFLEAWETLPFDDWESLLTRFLKHNNFWGPSSKTAWDTLLFYLKWDPTPIQEKLIPPQPPTRENIKSFLSSIPSIEKARSSLIQEKKKVPAAPKEKFKALPIHPVSLLKLYVSTKAPSPSYERVFSTVLIKCQNHHSSPGKQIYRYGQAHIAKNTGLPLRTIERAWAWLRKRGILNKAWHENPKTGKCSGWYVCTSLRQVGYYRDPENRRRKISR